MGDVYIERSRYSVEVTVRLEAGANDDDALDLAIKELKREQIRREARRKAGQ